MKQRKPFSTYEPFNNQERRMLETTLRTLTAYFGECPSTHSAKGCAACDAGKVIRSIRETIAEDEWERANPEASLAMRKKFFAHLVVVKKEHNAEIRKYGHVLSDKERRAAQRDAAAAKQRNAIGGSK